MEITKWLAQSKGLDPVTRGQLRRSSHSIALNIAEGSGSYSQMDRRNFFVVERNFAVEVAAMFDKLKAADGADKAVFQQFYGQANEMFRILCALIQKLQKPTQA